MLLSTSTPELGQDQLLFDGRFGLYEAENGQPVRLIGRFGTYKDILDHCAGSRNEKIVEVARYAYLPVSDFEDLFGPLRRRPIGLGN